MKRLLLLAFSSFYINLCYCQNIAQHKEKRPIDSSDYDKWPVAQGGYISNDGRYILYTIDKQPLGGATSVIRSTRDSWENETTGSDFGITADSRKAIYKRANDSLAIITLGTDSVEIIPHVRSHSFLGDNQDTWLVYYLMDTSKELFVRNLRTGQSVAISSATEYFFNNEGSTLIVKKESKKEGKITEFLDWVDLRKGNMITIWEGIGMGRVVFDKTYTQLAFPVEDSINNQIQRSIWYYKTGTDKATRMSDNGLAGGDRHLQIEYLDHFSEDGSRLFFKYKKAEEIKKVDTDAVQVDVWSYTDTKLQSQQLNELKNSFPKLYSAVIRIEDHEVFPLEQTGENIWESNDNFALLYHPEGDADFGEWNWNPACQFSFFLISTRDGSRKLIRENTSLFFRLSPEGKYLIWYDPKQKNYFSLEVATGITKNITKAIPTDWTEYRNDHPDAPEGVDALTGWLKGDATVLLHDQNDIWQVDPSGDHPPVSLTNGYGRKHHIVFRLATNEGHAVLSPDEKILLSAFNRSTKDNGFYSKLLSGKGDPILLTMGPYIYEVPGNNPGIDGQAPLKARDKEAYIVRRMSATESPNYFYTTDLINFCRMSDVHPEREVNWLTSELKSWKTLDGSISQGVLYKPENFDAKEKYPIIFYYYERLSDRLNEFKQPDVAEGRLDIPTYVSNGYLVFTPDIHYKIGQPGEGVVNSVLSAAGWLSKMPWVDSLKMGLQGHSFGGYETNYLVSHSHLFAAACSASGLSDYVSGYGELFDNGASLEAMFEKTQYRVGATLWERPDLYIKNSPIFRADLVTTPLLIMHTKNDGVVPFSNAVELFTALRRLSKKVWMLQYDNYNHSLSGNAAADFTIRMQQFFDHYLKGAPMPKWMKEGIPARMKGIERGLEIDNNEKN
jgi:dipeptidyl aminopeptidase/acylaminoacyl peptidase